MRYFTWKLELVSDILLVIADVDMNTNIQNIACLGKIMSICIEQRFRNSWGSIH